MPYRMDDTTHGDEMIPIPYIPIIYKMVGDVKI